MTLLWIGSIPVRLLRSTDNLIRNCLVGEGETMEVNGIAHEQAPRIRPFRFAEKCKATA
jgi:hypothetical protein